jgi:hypothetical protein
MALSNYGELKTAIATLLNRSDLTAAIPDFISMCDASLNRNTKARNRRMEALTSLTVNTGDQDITLPDDFIESRVAVLQSTPRRVLTYLTPDALESTYPDASAGIPTDFTIVGSTLRLGPQSNGNYTIALYYYKRITAMTADADVNWVLTYFPDVYLYGAAIHSAPYLGDDSRLQTWMGLYDRALGELAGDDARARWNGAPVRTTVDVVIV